jgi:hypothetical protein
LADQAGESLGVLSSLTAFLKLQKKIQYTGEAFPGPSHIYGMDLLQFDHLQNSE